MPDRRRSVVLLYLRTGSRFESPEQNGLSHFVEHMLFRGTEQHQSAFQLAQAFEDLGGTLDASTAADHGSLGIFVPPENLRAVLPLLSEVYRRPLFSDIDLERGIIREEIHEELNEQGKWTDPATLARATAFSDSPLGQPIIGTLSNVERFDLSEITRHHQRTYVGGSLVIAVAGPCDPTEIFEDVERAFADVPQGNILVPTLPLAQDAPRFSHVHQPGTSQTRLSLSFRCPGHHDPREPAMDMLMRIIDDGMATRLYHRLCDQRGLCYTVSGGYEAYSDVGLLELEADTAHENAEEVVKQMLALCTELNDDLITEQEFERARKRACWQYEALTDEVGDTADFLAMSALTQTSRTPSARLEQILAVSRDDIRAAAQAVFAREGRCLVAVGTNKASIRAQLQRLALS